MIPEPIVKWNPSITSSKFFKDWQNFWLSYNPQLKEHLVRGKFDAKLTPVYYGNQ